MTEPRPVLSLAEINNGFMRVKGEVRTTPDTTVSVNLFASDALAAFNTAEAKTALSGAKVKSDAAGLATFEIRFQMAKDLAGQWISAAATTPAGTQELSAPLRAVVNNQNFTVVNSGDSGAGSRNPGSPTATGQIAVGSPGAASASGSSGARLAIFRKCRQLGARLPPSSVAHAKILASRHMAAPSLTSVVFASPSFQPTG